MCVRSLLCRANATATSKASMAEMGDWDILGHPTSHRNYYWVHNVKLPHAYACKKRNTGIVWTFQFPNPVISQNSQENMLNLLVTELGYTVVWGYGACALLWKCATCSVLKTWLRSLCVVQLQFLLQTVWLVRTGRGSANRCLTRRSVLYTIQKRELLVLLLRASWSSWQSLGRQRCLEL